MTPKNSTPIEITVIPDAIGAEMLRLLADAIEEEAVKTPDGDRHCTARRPAFKLRRSTFKVLPGERS